ncbi:hypothetical protein ESCO_006147 [Escovopsis weberi]|uniref:Uncharacterized protein n=1 Tax=Escovopsis weberi TaxID=150374 RepID=A0A0M8N5D1_ESCWE|nr:hypothetical protein ESCO_006147 [Escovopsis weberi]
MNSYSKRLTQFSSQTPGPPRFTPTPRFGSSASKPTQSTGADAIEDDDDTSTSWGLEEAQLEIDADADADEDEDEDEDQEEGSEEGIRGRAKGKSIADVIDAEADWFARPARRVAQWMHSDALESEAGEWEMGRETKRRKTRMGSRSPR